MTQGKWMWVALVAGAMVAGELTANRAAAAPMDAATAEPMATTRPAGRTAAHRRLTKPWSEMKSLTPQQQDQIIKIHEDAVEQEKKVHQKEVDDITALLTPDQRAEMTEVEGKNKAMQKERNGSRRKHADMATTQPAQ